MKLMTFLILFSFTLQSRAEWPFPFFKGSKDQVQKPRVVWSCPTRNRGEMPKEREVSISYNASGELEFDPAIFKRRFNPINAIKGLFGGKRSGEDLDECVRSFLEHVPPAVSQYQQLNCQQQNGPLCSKNVADIGKDVARSIRGSQFYSRHANELASVGELNQVGPAPQVQTQPQLPRTKAALIPEQRNEVRVAPPPPVRDTQRARAALLDYLADNASVISRLKNYQSVCPQFEETSGANGNYCRFVYNQNSRFLNNVSRLFSEVRGEPVTVRTFLQSVECAPDQVANVSDIEDILHRMDMKQECTPLANVGDFKIFRKASGTAFHNTGNYLLKKTGENTYDAVLNLNFTQLNGADSSPQQMIGIIRNCFNAANPHIKGPNGERINVRPMTTQEVQAEFPRSEWPPQGQINLNPRNTSIDSGNFNSTIDCPTVVHELFHHMGLVDEYFEERTDNFHGITRATEWSCRVVPKGTSIMKDHIRGFNDAVPRQFSCNCVNDACRSIMTGSDQSSADMRKVLLTASPYLLLGNSSHCKVTAFPTVVTIAEPDKAFVNIQEGPGLLSFQHRSLFMVNGKFQYAAANMVCQCPPGDADCAGRNIEAAKKMRANEEIRECPAHTQRAGEPSMAPAGTETSFNPNGFTFVTRPVVRSLLTPNHFNHLMTGMCDGPARNYNRCVEFAYISEADRATCSQKPPQCTDPDYFYGTSTEAQ